MNTLEQKIIELVPEIKRLSCDVEGEEHVDSCYKIHPITLADVLRAINEQKKTRGVMLSSDAENREIDGIRLSLLRRWNLTTDLDGQNEECRTFIAKILGVEEEKVVDESV